MITTKRATPTPTPFGDYTRWQDLPAYCYAITNKICIGQGTCIDCAAYCFDNESLAKAFARLYVTHEGVECIDAPVYDCLEHYYIVRVYLKSRIHTS
jgi:hypothetical protein